MKKRLLFISNLFPNPLAPNQATFNRQQLDALRQFYDIDVIAPIPWGELARKRGGALSQTDRANGVAHPVYWYPPGCFRTTYGACYYHSIRRTAEKLLRTNTYDLIFASWLYPDGWAAARLAREFNVPLFVKVHGSDVNRLVPGSALAEESLSVVRAARTVICVSRALQERLLMLGCEPGKLRVVYNGINRELFRQRPQLEVRRELGINATDKLILFVGNLKIDKGLGELISAFERIADSDTRLVLIGSGPYDKEIRRKVAELSCPGTVSLLGGQPLERVALWMNAASLLCLPSYMEGVPNVVLEALASGTPVVATTVGGIPELDRGNGNMLLVEPRTVEPLAEALGLMLARGGGLIDSSFIRTWQEVGLELDDVFSAQQGGGR